MFCNYSKLVMLYKIGELHFCQLGKSGFHTREKNGRNTATSSCCCQNLKTENFMLSFGRLCEKITSKRVLHMQHDYFSSFHQSNHSFVALPLLLSLLKLPNKKIQVRYTVYWSNVHD